MRRRAAIQEKDIRYTPANAGIPQQDRSGQILAGGLQDFAKGLMVREEKSDRLTATAKFGDFVAAYSQGKAQLQLKHKETPGDYVGAAKEFGDMLAVQFSKDLPAGPAQKFRDMTTSAIAQDMDNVVGWSIKQDQDNIIGRIERSYGNVELAAEGAMTIPALEDVLGNGEGALNQVHDSATPFISSSSNYDKKEGSRKRAIDNSMNARILDDSRLLYGDLHTGAYDHLLTPGEVRKYETLALNSALTRASREEYERVKSTSVTLSLSADAIMRGEMSIGEVSRMAAIYEMRKDERDINGNLIVPPEVFINLEALRRMALDQIPLTKQQKTDAQKIADTEFDRDWNSFLSDKKKARSAEGARQELKIYARLTQQYADGVIDGPTYATKKAIMDKKVVTRSGVKSTGLTLEQAFLKAGKGTMFSKEDDLYVHGYDLIRRKLLADKTLSREQQRDYLDQYFLTYIQEIENLPPQQVDAMKNPETTAAKIVNGAPEKTGLYDRMAIVTHPDFPGESLVYGQRIIDKGIEKIFFGINPDTGRPRLGTPRSVRDGLENR